MSKNALIMVDLQNDFCPGGALGVADGDKLMPLANHLQSCFDVVVATQDWHPADHISFVNNHQNVQIGDVLMVDGVQQMIWPRHCEQGGQGASFHSELDLSRVDKVIRKGVDSHIDSYSAFFDNAHRQSTGLASYLQACDIHKVYIMGLATDYCVKYSVLDAISLGYEVCLIMDGCRGVDLNPGDVDRAMAEMRNAGARMVASEDILSIVKAS